jgi:hypothetical protein
VNHINLGVWVIQVTAGEPSKDVCLWLGKERTMRARASWRILGRATKDVILSHLL